MKKNKAGKGDEEDSCFLHLVRREGKENFKGREHQAGDTARATAQGEGVPSVFIEQQGAPCARAEFSREMIKGDKTFL